MGTVKTAANPATAHFKQDALPAGVKMLHQHEGSLLVARYDPTQIDALDARLLLNIFVDFTEGKQADGIRELGRNADATSRELYTILLHEIDRSGDAPGVIQWALDLMTLAISDRSHR